MFRKTFPDIYQLYDEDNLEHSYPILYQETTGEVIWKEYKSKEK